MDEPFGALDALTRVQMQDQVLAAWSRERRTVMFVTHDVDEAVYLAKRVIVMASRPGRLYEIVLVDLPYPRTEAMRAVAGVCRDPQTGLECGLPSATGVDGSGRRRRQSEKIEMKAFSRRAFVMGASSLAAAATARSRRPLPPTPCAWATSATSTARAWRRSRPIRTVGGARARSRPQGLHQRTDPDPGLRLGQSRLRLCRPRRRCGCRRAAGPR